MAGALGDIYRSAKSAKEKKSAKREIFYLKR